MLSVYSALFALLLFSDLSGVLVAVSIPGTQRDDGIMEQDGSLLGDKPIAGRLFDRQNLIVDTDLENEDWSRGIIVSDARLKGHGVHGLNPAFAQSRTLMLERRDTNNILQCLVGRVYRPCWKA